jgi:Rod binding domain-containing protein
MSITALGAAAPDASTMSSLSAPAEAVGNAPKNLQEASQRFEAMLVKYVLDAARPAEDEDNESLLDNDGARTYRGMLHQELAQSVATHSRLGVAEAMQRQLGGPGAAPTGD